MDDLSGHVRTIENRCIDCGSCQAFQSIVADTDGLVGVRADGPKHGGFLFSCFQLHRRHNPLRFTVREECLPSVIASSEIGRVSSLVLFRRFCINRILLH